MLKIFGRLNEGIAISIQSCKYLLLKNNAITNLPWRKFVYLHTSSLSRIQGDLNALSKYVNALSISSVMLSFQK